MGNIIRTAGACVLIYSLARLACKHAFEDAIEKQKAEAAKSAQ